MHHSPRSFGLGSGFARRPSNLSWGSKMIHTLSRFRIKETMPVYAATAREGISQYLRALEAESCVAIAAEHLVTLLVLLVLRFQALLGDRNSTSRALFSAGLLHPLPKALVVLRLFDLGLLGAFVTHAFGVLLASEALVVWLRPTTQTGLFLAFSAH